MDPLTWEYPMLTNYQYASDEPIANVDRDGLEADIVIQATKEAQQATEVVVTALRTTAKTATNFVGKVGNFFGKVGSFLGKEVLPRAVGLGKAVVGGVAMAAGAATSEFGVGIPIFALGADYGGTGLHQMWDGKEHEMLTTQALESSGMSHSDSKMFAEAPVEITAVLDMFKQPMNSPLMGKPEPLIPEFKPPYCFIAGTKVLTKNDFLNIEDIKVGDSVWAYSDSLRSNHLEAVEAVMVSRTGKLVGIAAGNETILATPEHPFYIMGLWQPAKKVAIGDSILLFSGKRQVVTNIFFRDSTATVYNLKVSEYHTYYVSRLGVLVHNDCISDKLRFLKKTPLKNIPSGCEDVAKAIQKKIGGQFLEITPKWRGAQIGTINNEATGWGWHVAVLKDGRVFDKLTGAEGMDLESYKKMFDYSDDLNFTARDAISLK